MTELEWTPDDSLAVATTHSPAGSAYRGHPDCTWPLCSMDGNPDRCYGWHCYRCGGPSNMQGDCLNCGPPS